MKLAELFNKVKEDNLSKYQLEDLHKHMSQAYAEMHLELGRVTKRKGLFMLNDPEKTAVAKKREWQGSEDGQKEIELKAMIKATSAHLSSLKSRLYSQY